MDKTIICEWPNILKHPLFLNIGTLNTGDRFALHNFKTFTCKINLFLGVESIKYVQCYALMKLFPNIGNQMNWLFTNEEILISSRSLLGQGLGKGRNIWRLNLA